MANRVDPSLRQANDILRQNDDRSNNVPRSRAEQAALGNATPNVKVIGETEARGMLKVLKGQDLEVGKAVLERWQKWDDEGRIRLEPDARRLIDMAHRNAEIVWNIRG